MWNFQSTSTDPEDDPLTEKWVFGDGGTGSGQGEVYRYTKPGNFTAALTVTDSYGLTNRAAKTINVPAPKPIVSISITSKNAKNRIEPDEVFTVRVAVTATSDGIGALTEVAFTAAALTIPESLTIVSAPEATPVGTLQPGDKSREFEWKLKATDSENSS